MTLCDAGALLALVDPGQVGPHSRFREALAALEAPLLTTWPCLTEAMHLAHRRGGWPMQRLLWRYLDEGALRVHKPTEEEIDRMEALMDHHRDAPMDLADASLVALAEVRGLTRIFTLDRRFHAYRIDDRRTFEVVPG